MDRQPRRAGLGVRQSCPICYISARLWLGSEPYKVLALVVIDSLSDPKVALAMDDLFLLCEAQMRRIAPFFPLSYGVPRVDDRRAVSGIVFVIKNGLRWRDAPAAYGRHKTIYNRFIRWSRMGVFNRIMIDATHLKVHRTAASLLKGEFYRDVSGAPRAA